MSFPNTIARPKWMLGVVFSSIPYQQGTGWGIGNGGSIPWYSAPERIEFSKLCSPYWRIVGRHSIHKFTGILPGGKNIYLSTQPDRGFLGWRHHHELFRAMNASKANPALVLGGRRTIQEALKWADFVIVHEMKNYVFCNQFVDFGGQYGNWREVSKREFRDFHQVRFVRTEFPTDSTAESTTTARTEAAEQRVKFLGTGK